MKMKRLLLVFVLLSVFAFGANGAWGQYSVPVINPSFELIWNFPEGPGLNYWAGPPPPVIMCPLDDNAKDGNHVLVLDLGVAGGYTYAFGPWQEQYGIDEIIKPGISYTVSAWAKKAADHSNNGGWMYVDVGPVRGDWGTYRIQIPIPPLTVDEEWVQYSVVLDTVANPEYVGNYISHVGLGGYYGDATTWMVWDHVTIDRPYTAAIEGTVTLSNWTPADPDKRLTPVKIELIPQGSGVAKTEVVVLPGNDMYVVDCEPGTYDVVFTAAGWLKKLKPGIVVVDVPVVCDAVLINGDIDGNDHIGTPDFSILSGSFDQTGGE